MMKHFVTAQFNSAGAKVFYVDGQRVSRKDAAAVYESAAAHKFFSQCDDFNCSCEGDFVVEVSGLHEVPIDNGADFGREGMKLWLEFKFCSGADSVLNALKLTAIAVAIPDVTRAKIYNAKLYNWKLQRCDEEAGIIVSSDKAWLTRTWGYVYQSYLDELAAQNYQPVIDCIAAHEKVQALTDEVLKLEERKRAAQREEMNAKDARDAAVEKHLQSFIA